MTRQMTTDNTGTPEAACSETKGELSDVPSMFQ